MYEDYVVGVKKTSNGILVEFSEDALASDWSTEVAMFVEGNEGTGNSSRYDITHNALYHRQSLCTGLDSMDAIKGSRYFNEDPANPNCLNVYLPSAEQATSFCIVFSSRIYMGQGAEQYYYDIQA